MTRAKEIAKTIRNAETWDAVIAEIEELCELAGMTKEWNEADGDTFEAVIYSSAEKLGVEI